MAEVVVSVVDAAAGYRGKVACAKLTQSVFAVFSAKWISVSSGLAVTSVSAAVLPAPLIPGCGAGPSSPPTTGVPPQSGAGQPPNLAGTCPPRLLVAALGSAASSAVLPSRFFGFFQAIWGRHSVVPHRNRSLRLGMAGRGSGDTIIRFGWHVQQLRQRESSSHGQVPG